MSFAVGVLENTPPIPHPPILSCGSIQTLVCIVFYLYVDVRPTQPFFLFVFVKNNSPLGTVIAMVSITLNSSLIYYLLHL